MTGTILASMTMAYFYREVNGGAGMTAPAGRLVIEVVDRLGAWYV